MNPERGAQFLSQPSPIANPTYLSPHQVRLLQARCADIEFFARDMEARGRARGRIDDRRRVKRAVGPARPPGPAGQVRQPLHPFALSPEPDRQLAARAGWLGLLGLPAVRPLVRGDVAAVDGKGAGRGGGVTPEGVVAGGKPRVDGRVLYVATGAPFADL